MPWCVICTWPQTSAFLCSGSWSGCLHTLLPNCRYVLYFTGSALHSWTGECHVNGCLSILCPYFASSWKLINFDHGRVLSGHMQPEEVFPPPNVNTTYLYPSYRLQSTTIQSSPYLLDYKSQLLNFCEMHINERESYVQASKQFWTILKSPHSAVLPAKCVNLQQCLLERCGAQNMVILINTRRKLQLQDADLETRTKNFRSWGQKPRG